HYSPLPLLFSSIIQSHRSTVFPFTTLFRSFNVLVGDMSLVGPRPIVADELDHYGGTAALLLSRKPGLTSNWAINGRSDVSYPQRADLELAYLRQWSLRNDVRIMLRTVQAVALKRGAY